MDSKTRNWLIGVCLLSFALGYYYHSSQTPKRPILNAIAGIFKTAKWVLPLVPFMLDEGPPQDTQEMYSELPPREVGADGYAQLDFSEGW